MNEETNTELETSTNTEIEKLSYTPTNWEDRIVEYPNRYKDQNNNYYYFTHEEGEVAKEGTLVDASKLNNMEKGIGGLYDAITDEITEKSTNKQIVTAKAVYDTFTKSQTITLSVDNWIENTDTEDLTLYEYIVQDESVTETTLVTGYPDLENQSKLSDGDIVSYNGGYKIRTTLLPGEDITLNITMQKAVVVS